VLLGAIVGLGATRAEAQDDLGAILELMRSDLNAAKVETIDSTMKLSAAEGERFWPIYRRYEAELATVSDQRVALVQELLQTFGTEDLDDRKVRDLTKRWLQYHQNRLDLWKKYQGHLEKELSAERAAQFLQIEHQMALLIDINIAAEMPLVTTGAPR
jgi:hypothetical protein